MNLLFQIYDNNMNKIFQACSPASQANLGGARNLKFSSRARDVCELCRVINTPSLY